jgi:SynChlorMet cassette protein ScmD
MIDNLISNPSIVLREEFDDWALLYNPDDGEAFGINPTGVFIWKRLDGKHTADQLLEELRASCGEVSDKAAAEVKTFMEGLVRKGLAGHEA